MSIPYIMSAMNMYMVRFPNFMRCHSCRHEFDEKEMSVDPLSRNVHNLVCQPCKQYALKWIEKNEPQEPKGQYKEPRPVDQFWDTEYKALRSN